MAVFMLNVCKFNGCGLTFKSLGHLIQHIEETHIDYDPHVVEQTELQQPTCIPLSYALRFLTDAARKEGLKPVSQGRLPRDASGGFASSTRGRGNAATTPTGSEAEEGDEFVSEPEDSNDSWTTSEEFSADFILRYGGNRVINPSAATPTNNNSSNSSSSSGSNSNSNATDKPFACPVPGCKKRYKNVNGIKYHSKNGHKNDGKIRKAFRCPCGKSYKTPYGLKNHAAIQHAGTVLQIKLLQNGKSSSSSSTAKSEQQQHQRENSSKTVPPLKIVKQTVAKAKVAAIEDHGYIKSEKTIYTDSGSESTTTRECEDEELGILTPASTPPLPSQSPAKTETILGNSQQQQQHERSLHKYLANVVASSQSGQSRRGVVENGNAY